MRIACVVLIALATVAAPRAQRAPAQTQTDEYTRYELLSPETASVSVTYEVSATTAGATRFVDPIRAGATVSNVSVIDLMTGEPLKFAAAPASITVTLARPVPQNGQGRIRITKTVKDAGRYAFAGGVGTFTQPLGAGRHSLLLPAGDELVACNVPVQVLSDPDGRIRIATMNVAPGTATMIVKLRKGAATGEAAKPKALTNNRSWEPPATQGPTERARLTERASQDRDIVYFLQQPSTNAFSLYHDYTESRPGTDKYVNVVRAGSRVSNPSAYILDTGEVLRHETLKGDAITAAKIDGVGVVTPDTEVVVLWFPPVKAGQSIRLRISETYTAPQSYRLDGDDLVFERSLGRPRNSVVLPPGWYLTASSIPAVISETSDKLIRLDFVNGRNDGSDVYLKARRRP
jgi:hypothetical protein